MITTLPVGKPCERVGAGSRRRADSFPSADIQQGHIGCSAMINLASIWPSRVTVVGLFLTAVALSGFASTAQASRRPTDSEGKAIRRAVMKTCQSDRSNRPCRFDGPWTRVSTRNTRYARGSATGMNFSPGGVLRRGLGGRWRWVIQSSGGPDSCANYRRLVPVSVLRDLRIGGYDGRC